MHAPRLHCAIFQITFPFSLFFREKCTVNEKKVIYLQMKRAICTFWYYTNLTSSIIFDVKHHL